MALTSKKKCSRTLKLYVQSVSFSSEIHFRYHTQPSIDFDVIFYPDFLDANLLFSFHHNFILMLFTQCIEILSHKEATITPKMKYIYWHFEQFVTFFITIMLWLRKTTLILWKIIFYGRIFIVPSKIAVCHHPWTIIHQHALDAKVELTIHIYDDALCEYIADFFHNNVEQRLLEELFNLGLSLGMAMLTCQSIL